MILEHLFYWFMGIFTSWFCYWWWKFTKATYHETKLYLKSFIFNLKS